MRTVLQYFGLVLIMCATGFWLGSYFLELSLWQIRGSHVYFLSRHVSTHFFSILIFALSLGSIPLLYLIIKRLTQLRFIMQGIVACGMIIGSGIVFWQFRVYQLKVTVQQLSADNIGNGNEISMDYAALDFDSYLFLGFLIGALISVIIFWNLGKKESDIRKGM